MLTARLKLRYSCISQAKSREKTSQRGKQCDDVQSRVYYVFIMN